MTLTIDNITRHNSTHNAELKLPNIPQQHTILDSVWIGMYYDEHMLTQDFY
jgi:hypothetical protein